MESKAAKNTATQATEKAASRATEKADFGEILINVLGYKEEDQWVALALEMDIRGYGETFETALQDMLELVEMQVSFALQQGLPEMILEPAEEVWFERWAEEHNKRLLGHWVDRGDSAPDAEYKIGAIPPPRIAAAEFSRVDA